MSHIITISIVHTTFYSTTNSKLHSSPDLRVHAEDVLVQRHALLLANLLRREAGAHQRNLHGGDY